MFEGLPSGKEKPQNTPPSRLGRFLEEADRSKEGEKGESDVYEFEGEDGKLMIRKILRESVGKTKEELERLKTQLETQYQLLVKYLGDRIVPTEYIIITLKNGSDALTVVQEKVLGTRFDKMRATAGSELAKKFLDEIIDIKTAVREAQKDPQTKDLFGVNPRAGGAFNNAILNVNQIWTEEGKLKIIDWT